MRVARRQRLLDQLDAERLELGHELDRRVHRPGLVGVDPDQGVRRLGAHRADALEVGRAAHLDLEGVVGRRGRGSPGGALDRVDRDRVAGRRRRRVEPEDAPERLAADLAEQVVQGAVDGALGGHLARDGADAGEDGRDRERVVAEQRLHLLEKPHRACDRLVVVLVGRALAVSDQVAVPDRHLDDLRVGVRAARDDERLGVLELEDAGDQVHRRPAYPTALAA